MNKNQTIGLDLQKLGMPCHVVGFNYTKEAIELVVKDATYLYRGITKRLYPDIAEKFNTTPSRVERAIRHTLEMTWNRLVIKDNCKELFTEIMGPVDFPLHPMTNAEFIATFAERLRPLIDKAS